MILSREAAATLEVVSFASCIKCCLQNETLNYKWNLWVLVRKDQFLLTIKA